MLRSHSFAGVRGLKYVSPMVTCSKKIVALLRGGAWIEIQEVPEANDGGSVALLRGGAWIEIFFGRLVARFKRRVALLRGGAWIEIRFAGRCR